MTETISRETFWNPLQALVWIAFRSDAILDDLGRDTRYLQYRSFESSRTPEGWSDYERVTLDADNQLYRALQRGEVVAVGKIAKEPRTPIPPTYWIDGRFSLLKIDKTRGETPHYEGVRIASADVQALWPRLECAGSPARIQNHNVRPTSKREACRFVIRKRYPQGLPETLTGWRLTPCVKMFESNIPIIIRYHAAL